MKQSEREETTTRCVQETYQTDASPSPLEDRDFP
jgi:hypothetical protein